MRVLLITICKTDYFKKYSDEQLALITNNMLEGYRHVDDIDTLH